MTNDTKTPDTATANPAADAAANPAANTAIAPAAPPTAHPTGAGAAAQRRPASDGVSVGLLAVIAGTFGVMAAFGEVFVDALVFLVAFAGLAAWAARRPSPRLRWVIAGLLTLFVGVNLVYAIGDLSHPESPAPFITSAVVIGAGVITIVLAVLAARRRPARGRRVWTVALAGLGIVVIVALTAAAAVVDDELLPGDTEIVTRDATYPEQVDVAADSPAMLIRNKDAFRHTFVVDGAVDAVEIPAGSAVRVELDLEPGSYRYFCDIPGHDMEGTLVVN